MHLQTRWGGGVATPEILLLHNPIRGSRSYTICMYLHVIEMGVGMTEKGVKVRDKSEGRERVDYSLALNYI